ncbi:serine protease [Candidatus Methanophagaceae archaeon]|nr:serine protease [Methanophagales archaeon]
MSKDTTTRCRNTFVRAVATVTIFDESDNPVEGATVSGQWSNATSDSDSGVTDASGQVSLESDSVKNPSGGTTFTFTVDGVTKAGCDYDSEANVETSKSINV